MPPNGYRREVQLLSGLSRQRSDRLSEDVGAVQLDPHRRRTGGRDPRFPRSEGDRQRIGSAGVVVEGEPDRDRHM